MLTPTPRLFVVLASPRDIEIIIVGAPLLIAPLVTELHIMLEAADGFESVQPLVMGAQQVGFRATRSKRATHDDPIAEAMLVLRRFPITWEVVGPRLVGGTW